jgi:carboxypeptidase D
MRSDDICETTTGVKSFSGYVNLTANASEGRPYDIHTFFWFFEARKKSRNAPLPLWLQVGPGSPSTPATVGENGPCRVARDSKHTVLNPWSWDNQANILYLGQSVQTGFSYDMLVRGTIDETLIPWEVTPLSPSAPASQLNTIFVLGTFSLQNPSSTANTNYRSGPCSIALHADIDEAVRLLTPASPRMYVANDADGGYHQSASAGFPQYRPKDCGFIIWSDSYGGHFGPTFADFFTTQSEKETSGVPLQIDAIGIINGCSTS